MPAVKLTTARIVAFAPRPKPYDVRDAELTGLVVRVQPSGEKAFNLRYRLGDGSQRTFKLGSVVIGIGQARKLALGKLAEVAAGGDPATARRGARAAAKLKTTQAAERRLGTYLVGPYAKHVLAEQKRGAETLARIERTFAGWLDLDLAMITEARALDWRADRIQAGIAKATIDREVGMLGALLNHAVRVSELLPANPLARLKPLVKAATKTNVLRYLSDAEEACLREALHERDAAIRAGRARANALRAASRQPVLPDHPVHFIDHLEPMILVKLNTGLRYGELVQLSWSSVDFRSRLITVHGDTAKSALTRHVPMTDEVLSVLSRWRARDHTKRQMAGELVFPGKAGPLTDIKNGWKPLLQRAGIKNFRIHDLRHTFASRLVQRGVDLYRVQKLLGHSTPVMTQRYAHLQSEHLADAVRVLDRPVMLPAETSRSTAAE
jgi:integrase